jgi:hypothetical protein
MLPEMAPAIAARADGFDTMVTKNTATTKKHFQEPGCPPG